MKKLALSLATLLTSVISTSAFASSVSSLEDVQTKLAPLIPQGRSIREMSGYTKSSRGATCFTSISIKPDEVEFMSTWGDSGLALRLNSEDEIEIEETPTQLKFSTEREGLPTSVTLTLQGTEVIAIFFEETHRSIFYKRTTTHLCDQQVTSFPTVR